MTEPEFENYVRSIGYDNVAMDEDIEIRNGVDILMDYLNDTQNSGIIRLRDIYNQISIIEEVTR